MSFGLVHAQKPTNPDINHEFPKNILCYYTATCTIMILLKKKNEVDKMASKWKGSYESGRKYNKAWGSKYSWVSKASDGTENVLCKLCHTTIKPKASNLTNREQTGKHVERVNLSGPSAQGGVNC